MPDWQNSSTSLLSCTPRLSIIINGYFSAPATMRVDVIFGRMNRTRGDDAQQTSDEPIAHRLPECRDSLECGGLTPHGALPSPAATTQNGEAALPNDCARRKTGAARGVSVSRRKPRMKVDERRWERRAAPMLRAMRRKVVPELQLVSAHRLGLDHKSAPSPSYALKRRNYFALSRQSPSRPSPRSRP